MQVLLLYIFILIIPVITLNQFTYNCKAMLIIFIFCCFRGGTYMYILHIKRMMEKNYIGCYYPKKIEICNYTYTYFMHTCSQNRYFLFFFPCEIKINSILNGILNLKLCYTQHTYLLLLNNFILKNFYSFFLAK